MENKLNNLQKHSKPYWSLVICFLNNEKIPLIPPLFPENKFLTIFLEKAEFFNSFFSKECSLINNASTLLTHIQYLTNNCLSFVTFSHDDIAKKLKILTLVKRTSTILLAYLCWKFVALAIICRQCVDTGVFPS